MALNVLEMWGRLGKLPAGNRLFTTAVCLRAPYFRSIAPRFEELRPGRAVVAVPNRRRVRNHLGTVHAIACCNAAELAAGVMVEVSIPPTHRWIPVGMDVRYLRKATTDLRAIADCPLPELAPDRPTDWVVPVRILDRDDREVVHAEITMSVALRPKAA